MCMNGVYMENKVSVVGMVGLGISVMGCVISLHC